MGNNNTTIVYNTSVLKRSILIFPILFILNPTLGWLSCLIFILLTRSNIKNNSQYILLFGLLACWLGFVNMTKTPANDMAMYIDMFNDIPNDSLWGHIKKEMDFKQEYFYRIITYIGYYICLGKAPIFIFILTFVMYMMLYMAMFKLFRKLELSKSCIICGALSLTFFSQYFLLTAHLIRQELATSIVFYAIISRIVTGKNNWVLLITAVLTHTSAGLIAAMSFIPWIYKKMSFKRIFIILVCFAPIVIVNSQIGQLLGGANSSIYAIQRYTTAITDTHAVPLSTMLIVYVPLIIISIKLLYKLRNTKYHLLYPVIYIFMLLFLFVISFTQSPLIQYRFFYFSYAFIPFLIPLMFYKESKLLNLLYSICVSLFFMIRFFMIHNTSDFDYASVFDLITMSFPSIFINPYY